jgi:hypothetical protein
MKVNGMKLKMTRRRAERDKLNRKRRSNNQPLFNKRAKMILTGQ